MKQKSTKIISGLLVILMVLETLSGSSSIGRGDVDAKSKVHFEGVQVGECETSSEVAHVMNNADAGMRTTLIIELDNYWKTDEGSVVSETDSIEDVQHMLRIL